MTILLIEGFDGIEDASALTAASKWGNVTGSPTIVEGRMGGSDKAMLFENGDAIVAGKAGSVTVRVAFALALMPTITAGSILRLKRPDDDTVFSIWRAPDTNHLLFNEGNSPSAGLLGTTADSLGLETWHWVELVMRTGIEEAEGGALKVWIDGDLVLDLHDVNTTDEGTTITGYQFGHSSSGSSFMLDDVVFDGIEDDDGEEVDAQVPFGDSRVTTFFPTSDVILDENFVISNGASAWAVVDEAPPTTDEDYISNAVAEEFAVFGSSGVLPFQPLNVYAVTVNVRGRKDIAGTTSFKPLLRIGSTNYLGDESFLAMGLSDFQYTWNANPATLGGWTQEAVESVNFGLKVES